MNTLHRIRFSFSTLTRATNPRFLLRCIVLASGIILAISLTTKTANAETRIVNLPFNFSIDGEIFPSGAYSIERAWRTGSVTLKNEDASRSFTWGLGPGDPAPTDTRVVLRFDKIGHSYALRSVQFESMITPRLDKKVMEKGQLSEQVVLAR
jgi:hypothetical protein